MMATKFTLYHKHNIKLYGMKSYMKMKSRFMLMKYEIAVAIRDAGSQVRSAEFK